MRLLPVSIRSLPVHAALVGCALCAVPSPSQSALSDRYRDLTASERRLALRYFWQLPGVWSAAHFAEDEAARRYPQLGGSDDQRDAFRHSTWNGSMTRRFESPDAAKRWGDAHEDAPNNPATRKAMDLNNNEQGRQLTWAARTRGPWWNRTQLPSDDWVANRMQRAVDAGELRMIEVVGGQRDPQNGALVPTTRP